MKRTLIILLAFAAAHVGKSAGQTPWTMQQCMQYAVKHNHEVRRTELELDNRKADKTAAIGNFLPSVGASVGAQYNFGRAINPETNGYTDVSTFYNEYSLYASLPVFDGFSRLHALKAAEASRLMGHQALRQQQNETALSVLQAFTSVAYYEGLVKMAAEKVAETELLLRQTRILEEVGRKSHTDVALVESQKAEADYELTRQQSLYESALLELKKEMAFPVADSLLLDVQTTKTDEAVLSGIMLNDEEHAALQQARYKITASKHEWRQARASLMPTLSVGAGIGTTFYKTLHSANTAAFSSQFKNNMGEYVGFTLSIPIFSRLQTLTGIRRAKNNYKMACEAYEQKHLELEKLSREAWQDWQGYIKQTMQMEKKVEADSLAYQLTRRQFEEGLSTAIDLHTTSAELLKSKATLLQCRLMTMVKEQLVKYYRGETIWTEQ